MTAYKRAPATVLRAARVAHEGARVDGFRVTDAEGRIVLDYVDRVGGG